MQLFIQEIKANLKSLIIWSISVVLLIWAGMGKYAAASSSGDSMNDLISKMPEPIKNIIGFGSLDPSQAVGYFGILYMDVALILAIQAGMLGADILSKEERDKTAEYLYPKPISRSKILSLKVIVALINIIIFNLVATAVSVLLVNHYAKSAHTDQIVSLMQGGLLMQIIFFLIGLAISAISNNPKSAASINAGFIIGTYILSILINLNDKLISLKYLTPFRYFETDKLLRNEPIQPVFIVIILGIIVCTTVFSYWSFNRRDLKV